MLKRINLYIQFPSEITVGKLKIPQTYETQIFSNTDETDIEKSYKQLFHFFKVYNQNPDDYDFYNNTNGIKAKLNEKEIGELLISPSLKDDKIYCIYKGSRY